jgi:hypothetical protein
MRDDFSPKTIDQLAKRVCCRCSNPDCGQITSGPQSDPNKSVNVGVASHITAASPDGPRYDTSISHEQRKSILNGIWLCQKCGKLVDNDSARYTVDKLKKWKKLAEENTIKEIEGTKNKHLHESEKNDSHFKKVEKLVPELLNEMKKDLLDFPLRREFILLSKSWAYNGSGDILVYYFDDHPDLKNKIRILQNNGLIDEITYNTVDRYIITEAFAEYLSN